MSEFNLKSGNSTPFKMMGSSSPLRGCADDPTGKGCGGDFSIGGQGKEKIKKTISNVKKKVSEFFRKKKKSLSNEQKREQYDKAESPTHVPVNPAALRTDVAEAEIKAKKLNVTNPYVGGS